MAYGTIATDTVQSSTAGVPPQFNDGSGSQVGALCRAWVSFDGTNGTIWQSLNVSSVTRTTTGQYTVNLSKTMPDTNYSIFACGANSGNGTSYVSLRGIGNTTTTSSFMLTGSNGANGITDVTWTYAAIFR